MKRFIFYCFSFTMYGFILRENILNLNVVSIVLILYLVMCSIIMLKGGNSHLYTKVIFYVNNLIIYPLLLNNYSTEMSEKFTLLLFLLLLFYIISGIIEINRELIIFSLLILTLNCSLLNLYIGVVEFKEENILFMGLVNYLWFTCSNSSKIIKKSKKRKIKKDVEV